MDKLRALEVFRRVIELGSFSAAAEDLNLSKAAVSKNINELEDSLKTALINRTTRKLHITESGKAYYNHVSAILNDLANADLSILETSNVLRGTLRISIPMTLGVLKINPIICRFQKQYPNVSIEVTMDDSYVDLLEKGIDIAIRGGGILKDSSLKSRKLLDIERVVCASPEYLAANPKLTEPKDLLSHNCLIYTLSSSRSWVFTKGTQTQTVHPKPSSYAVNNGLGLRQAIVSGLGVTLTPKMIVDDAIAAGHVVELMSDWKSENHTLYALYPYHKEQSPKLRTFIDFLASHLST
ncbi:MULTISPECIES: LysR family transcriptional regulator [unclassified Alteromonas]|uniref:LysR family transcriptional regulator n=1 Tax=unclassified Alteromonas TaxID=2614992 RepID=UPI0019247CA6|nr:MULTISPECIES: LysR family transcriptional regulator [unclassified Alteromonas]